MTKKPNRPRPARKSKKKAKIETVSNFENDPTPERLNQAKDQVDGFKTESGRTVKRLNAILDHMLSRGMIDGPLYQAGWLCYSQYLGSLAPSGTVDPSKPFVDGGSDSGDAFQRRMDNRRKHEAALASLSKPHRRAFEVLVLGEIHVAVFGLVYYGYKRVETASAVSYATLKDALVDLVDHYSGRHQIPQNSGIRSHRDDAARATNRPDIREEVA